MSQRAWPTTTSETVTLEKHDGQEWKELGYLNNIVVDLKLGSVYVSSDGHIYRMNVSPTSVIDHELSKVYEISQFPPGLKPIIVAYTGTYGDIDLLYNGSGLIEANRIAVNRSNGQVVATCTGSKDARMICIDSHTKEWKILKTHSDIESLPTSIVSDGDDGGFYFLQSGNVCCYTPLEHNLSIRHMTDDGWISVRACVEKELPSDPPLSSLMYSALDVNPITHTAFVVAGSSRFTAVHRLISIPIPSSPATPFSSTAIRCCGLGVHSIAVVTDPNLVFVAHFDKICAVTPDQTVHSVCSFPDRGWSSYRTVCIAFYPFSHDNLIGYLFILADERGATSPDQATHFLYHLPISNLFPSPLAVADITPSSTKRRRV